MKKNEAISILATSVRPREQKDRARYDEAVKMAIDALNEPERKTGKWIYGENKYGHDGWQCDQCGHWILWDYHVSMEDAERDLPKYCPNCGARMVQEGEDNGQTD